MRGKKLLAGLLSLAMLVGLVPGAALAAERTVWYYNDYESGDIATGAAVVAKSNKIEAYADSDDNTCVMIEATGGEDCYFEANTSGIGWDNVVVDISLSIKDRSPGGNLQFKDKDKKQGTLFTFSADVVKSAGSGKELGTLKKGKWLDLSFVLNFTDRTYSTYVGGKQVEKGVAMKGDASKEFINMRLYVAKGTTGGILLDNFAVYQGTEPRDVSDEYEPAPTMAPAGPGKDYVLNTPDLTKLDTGVVLLLDNANAYAKKDLTKVDPQNEAVVPFTTNDRTLVPVRFISESIGAQVSWDEDTQTVTVTGEGKNITLTLGQAEMYVDGEKVALDAAADTYYDRTMLPLRALVEALGKNVYWDERGLILITDPTITLDAETDARLIGAMYGYLKTGTLALNYAAAPSYTQSVIDEAIKAPSLSYKGGANAGAGEKGAKALYYLTLSEYLGMDAKATDGTTAKDGALKQLRSLIGGGNEPFACVGCYWSHAAVAADLVLVKNTPSIYNELTQDEKDRMDWLMKALAVAGNWGFNDENNYKTGTDLMGNFGKTWNPNYRNAYLPVVLSGAMYFGAEELDKIFVSFSYDEYMKKFDEYGFTNIKKAWEPAGKDAMEKGGEVTLLGGIGASGMVAGQSGGSGKGVKLPFKYNGMGLDQIQEIYVKLMEYTYGKVVRSDYGVKGDKDYSYIISGKESPYTGYNGMMTEFAGSDGSGLRSNAGYGFDSFMSIVPTLANLKLFGIWDSSTPAQQKVDALMYVGNNDLIFKMQEGYHGFSTGSVHEVYEYGSVTRGYSMDKDIWRTFHCFETTPTTIAKDPNKVNLPDMPKAEPKDGVTEAPDGALVPGFYSGKFPEESYIKLDKKYTGDVTAEFDLVFGPEVDELFDGVIMYDAADAKDLTYQKTNALIQLKDGTINIMNGSGYKPTSFQVVPNYRYHIKATMNAKTKKWNVWVTPTYPTEGKETLVAENYSFRTGANDISDIGSLILVQASATGSYWIENHTVTE